MSTRPLIAVLAIAPSVFGLRTIGAVLASGLSCWGGCEDFARGKYATALGWWIVAAGVLLISAVDPIVHQTWSILGILVLALVTELVLVAYRLRSLL